MGRRKLEMKLIPEKRARMLSFKKRKEGLMKKIEELMTLCDVKACMIIYGPDDQQHHPEIYPKDPRETRGMIDYYNGKKRDPCKQKAYGLSCYFKERENQVEKELVKLREKKMNVKYPTWNSELESERDPLVLTRLAHQLSVKTQIVKSRIDFLKKQESENQFPPFHDMAPTSTSSCSSTTNIFMPGIGGYNESRGEIVNYEAEVGLQEYMGLTNDGSEYYWPPPINVDDGGSDCLLPLPQSYVSFPSLNQSEGDDLQQLLTYMITDAEGSQYLLPFN